MNLIQRYVQAVIAFLPSKQQTEVSLELTSHIMDMIEASQGDEKEVTIQVLESLGSPRKLADSYLNRSHFLIGPRYFVTFTKIMKIVLMALAIAFTVVFVTRIMFSTTLSFIIILEFGATLVNASLMAFAYVALIFYLLERYEVKLDDDNLAETWKITQLTQEGDVSKTHPFEHITEIILTTVFLFIVNFHPLLFSIRYTHETGYHVIALLNEATRSSWIGLLNAWLLLVLVSAIFKSVNRINIKHRLKYGIIMDTIALILFLLLAFTQNVLNSNVTDLIDPGNEALAMLYERGTLLIMCVIIAFSAYEILVASFKYVKYRRMTTK